MLPQSNVHLSLQKNYLSQKIDPHQEKRKTQVIYVAVHNNIQQWLIILTFIKCNSDPFPCLYFYSYTHTAKTWGQLWNRDQIQHNYGNGLPFSPSQPHRTLPSIPTASLPFSLWLWVYPRLPEDMSNVLRSV